MNINTTAPWNVGILIFDGVEVLDFAGPFEVFSRTRLVPGLDSRRPRSDDDDDVNEDTPLNVFTVAQSGADTEIVATGGLRIVPHHGFDSAPSIDLLVVPGGFGTRSLLNNQDVITWIAKTAASAQRVTSVCTGALLLAKAGLLSSKRATTHWGAYDTLTEVDGTIAVDRGARVVESKDGVITSAGVAAGIDMAFSVVESLFGREVADDTARYIDYPRTQHRNRNRIRAASDAIPEEPSDGNGTECKSSPSASRAIPQPVHASSRSFSLCHGELQE